MKPLTKKITSFLPVLYVLLVSLVLFSCGGGGDSDTPTNICDEGYEFIDGACNITGTLVDTDADSISDSLDNCPQNWNPSQSTSGDTDSIADACDNCMYDDNGDQADMDGDGIGDACETDTDGDGVENEPDNCDNTVNSDQANADGDACGDVCDDNDENASVCDDADGDGVDDLVDNCPELPNDQCDSNHNNVGNDCDTEPLSACPEGFPDRDNDGICDDFDNCPDNPNLCQNQADSDENGLPDDCNTLIDADTDGYASNDPDATKKDCDDGNPNAHPGAAEDCDGVDTDCNGALDNGFEDHTYYQDADHDGFGNENGPTKVACEKPVSCSTTSPASTPSGTKLIVSCVEDHSDCDDSNPEVNPEETEVADDDTIDNDCKDGDIAAEEGTTNVEADTASAFWHGGSFKHADEKNSEMEEMGFYVGNVDINEDISSGVDTGKELEDIDFDNDGDADVQLSYVVGSNLVSHNGAEHDFSVWHSSMKANTQAMGFYQGEISKTDSYVKNSATETIDNTPTGMGLSGYDKYIIVLRGFEIEYKYHASFEKLKIRIYWDSNDPSSVTSNANLNPKYVIESHEDGDTNFKYVIKYTVIGINTNYAGYGEKRMLSDTNKWQITSVDGLSSTKEVESITMSNSFDHAITVAAISGFTIESYDAGNNTYGETEHDIIQLGFHISNWSVEGTNGSVTYKATANLNTKEMGAAFKFDTVMLSVDPHYSKRDLPNGQIEEYKPDTTSSGRRSQYYFCNDVIGSWYCADQDTYQTAMAEWTELP